MTRELGRRPGLTCSFECHASLSHCFSNQSDHWGSSSSNIADLAWQTQAWCETIWQLRRCRDAKPPTDYCIVVFIQMR
ncbi:hypothetical protein PoB_001226900 [Plakobranchus ocellatus]|uniref:Uncharacterized protein n=1 Tax=Plakobranchus ocellatus TaxID=259542 RepID=A0AAV3YVK4_9GAST|nr:hypothetical protein PoB_001226900 [Plakobranchus ocellatus]